MPLYGFLVFVVLCGCGPGPPGGNRQPRGLQQETISAAAKVGIESPVQERSDRSRGSAPVNGSPKNKAVNYWMNMIPQCRKHISMVIGRSLFP